MQSRTPIPPPRLPPPRAALQDVTARANQSPVTAPPSMKNTPVGRSSMDADYWAREKIRTRDVENAFREAFQQTAVDVGGRAKGTLILPNGFRLPGGYIVGQQAPAAAPAPAAVPAPARQPAASGSRKRKSDATSDDAIAAYKQALDHIDVSDMAVDKDCTAVRALINRVLDRGIFKKGEFCDTIGCSSNAVNRFLAQTGRDGGFGSSVYWEAWAWFKKRELAGLSMPSASAATQKKAKTAKASLPSVVDLNNIHLDGEETDSVPVYETCDVVRRKITAHLKNPGLTQAQFCRDLHAQLNVPGCKSIQSKMLADFRKKKGPQSGCTSSVYYAAYVYFEKLRLAEGKPKSKHRIEMEQIYPAGADRDRDASRGYWIHASEDVVEDEYGRVKFVKRR